MKNPDHTRQGVRYAGADGGWGPHDQEYHTPWDMPSWVIWNHEGFERVKLIKTKDIPFFGSNPYWEFILKKYDEE